MYTWLYVGMYVCIHVGMYVCIHGYMHACMYVYMVTCTHVCMYTWLRARMYVCMYVCMYVRVYVRKQVTDHLSLMCIHTCRRCTKWCPSPTKMTRSVVEGAVGRARKAMDVKAIDLLQFHWSVFGESDGSETRNTQNLRSHFQTLRLGKLELGRKRNPKA